jgi:hypothetical protein
MQAKQLEQQLLSTLVAPREHIREELLQLPHTMRLYEDTLKFLEDVTNPKISRMASPEVM